MRLGRITPHRTLLRSSSSSPYNKPPPNTPSSPRHYHPFLTTKNDRTNCTSSLLQQPLNLKPPLLTSYYFFTPRLLSTWANHTATDCQLRDNHPLQGETTEDGEIDIWEDNPEVEWEEEEEAEAKIGDGGDGGGVVLQGVPWGERVLSIAHEVLLQFGNDVKLFAFKTTPRGYIYVRLDKLSTEYGCPSIEELESYCQEYRKRLDEVGVLGEIPDNLAVEVSSPGAERLLKVPDDLSRFKDMPMRVCYVEGVESHFSEKDGVFFLDSIENEPESCIWRLANVKENRDPESKGRPMSRKKRDWRLKLPFEMHRNVALYLEA